MGGHQWTDALGQSHSAVVGTEFDLVISLFTRPGHGPELGVDHLIAEIPDGPLTAEQIQALQQLAKTAANAMRRGRTVLAHCNAGYNRSGLVVAQTLIELGQHARTAIQLIQERRSPWAVNNQMFEEYLTTGLDVASLLVSLDTAN